MTSEPHSGPLLFCDPLVSRAPTRLLALELRTLLDPRAAVARAQQQRVSFADLDVLRLEDRLELVAVHAIPRLEPGHAAMTRRVDQDAARHDAAARVCDRVA